MNICETARFDANEFFANKSGLGVTPFRLNQYGVAIGGPVVLPKLNLRDKMFWFASWEGFRRRRGSAVLASVPPEAFRRGDFSSLLQGSSPTIIRDPVNGNVPFPEQRHSPNRINPAIPTALAADGSATESQRRCAEPGKQLQ